MGEIADEHVAMLAGGKWGMPFRRKQTTWTPPNKTAQLYEFDVLEEDDVGRKENIIESYLRKQVKALGGEHRKVVYQGRTGSPDDWCFMPGGRLIIIECKATGKRPDPHQAEEIKWLRSMGFDAHWVDSKEGVDKLLEKFKEVDFL